MDLLKDLNPQQIKAVSAPLGPALVLAGPGSGKTRVLAHRIAYLIGHSDIQPNHILAMTFTNKAAREMGGRVRQLLGKETDQQVAGWVHLGTFHAMCARILRREAEILPITRDYVIFDQDDQHGLVRNILKELDVDPKQFQPAKVHGMISRAKNELVDLEAFTAETYFGEVAKRVYERYQKRLLANNALDFDDLLLWAVRLLEQHPDLREKYRRLYPHILVDEFQDTNTAQYVLLSLLAGVRPDLFVVGDPDQSIYRWRGADYRNVHRFQQDYPGAQIILLEQNYRSTQTILDAAMAVIDRNPGRHRKNLFTDRGPGERIMLHESYNEEDEAAFVVDTIATLTAGGGVEPGQCAIMYRTNAQSRALEEAFLRAGLAYRLVGAQRFYGRREVRDIIAYLRLIHNPMDQVSLLRVLNTPPRGIGAKTVAALLVHASSSGRTPAETLLALAKHGGELHISTIGSRAHKALEGFGEMLLGWIEARTELAVAELIDHILEDTHYAEYLDDGSEEGEERWANVLELRGAAQDFAEMGLATFLEHIALVSDQDTLTESLNAPTLLTLHAAKGLEFPVVFIIGLDEGVLPHQRSFDDPEAMAEERRLFYVGITRTMDRLFLLRAFRRRQAGSSRLSEPSQFLDDLPPDLVDGTIPSALAWDQISYQRQTRWEQPLKTPAKSRYHPGMRVRHARFGEGIVQETTMDFDDEEVTVEFESVGMKRLVASLAQLTILTD